MPTYEYRCPNGHTFDLFQRMSEEPRANCPECGLESERLLSGGAGFLFKGKGFYVTDYRSEDYKKAASRESGADAGSTEGAGSSSKESDGKVEKKTKAPDAGAKSPPKKEG